MSKVEKFGEPWDSALAGLSHKCILEIRRLLDKYNRLERALEKKARAERAKVNMQPTAKMKSC